jgi:ribosomal protein S14
MYYKCGEGHKLGLAKLMFDALRDFSESKPVSDCPACGRPRGLYRLFDFGLGARQAECKVLHAFLPREPECWQHGQEWVNFYPFLIAMEYTDGRGKTFWLPYWHTVTREGSGKREIKKYGQWAPFLGEDLFRSLLAQARGKGYLIE